MTSDVVDLSAYGRATFVVYRGVATGGTAAPTYTVLACYDTTPSNTTAVAFTYRKIDTGDTPARSPRPRSPASRPRPAHPSST